MKLLSSVLAIILFSFSSCNNPQTKEHSTAEIPKALEDKNSSYEIVKRKSRNDLVEGLYRELADKTPDLKELENTISDLGDSRNDSARAFYDYQRNNRAYFEAANTNINQIQDSILKTKMKVLIANHSAKYNLSITAHNDLLKSIDNQTTALSDLHTVLKITKSLQVITEYQKSNLPPLTSLSGYLRRVNSTIKYTDSLTK